MKIESDHVNRLAQWLAQSEQKKISIVVVRQSFRSFSYSKLTNSTLTQNSAVGRPLAPDSIASGLWPCASVLTSLNLTWPHRWFWILHEIIYIKHQPHSTWHRVDSKWSDNGVMINTGLVTKYRTRLNSSDCKQAGHRQSLTDRYFGLALSVL